MRRAKRDANQFLDSLIATRANRQRYFRGKGRREPNTRSLIFFKHIVKGERKKKISYNRLVRMVEEIITNNYSIVQSIYLDRILYGLIS